MQQFRMTGVFRDELEEFIAEEDLKYESSLSLPGQFGKPVPLDFLIFGRQTKSLVKTLSTGNSSASHNLSNEVFRCWYDLKQPQSGSQFVTVYDDRTNVFRDDDIDRLMTISLVLAFPGEQEKLKEAVAA